MILRTSMWLMLAMLALPAAAFAADGPDSADAAEESTALPAEGTESSTQPAGADIIRNLAAETVELMQQAQAGLADGQLTEETDALQTGITERLQRLAELARSQATKTSSGQSQPTGARAAAATNAGDGQGAAGRNDNAAESSESATGSAETETSGTTARNLATSVWGHLPARQRDRMRSRFSERFLPQYEDLVRQYYEALATEGASDP